MTVDTTEPDPPTSGRRPRFPTSDVVSTVLAVPIVALVIWGFRALIGDDEGYLDSLVFAALLALLNIGIEVYRWRRAGRQSASPT